jgi:hypothetical protein
MPVFKGLEKRNKIERKAHKIKEINTKYLLLITFLKTTKMSDFGGENRVNEPKINKNRTANKRQNDFCLSFCCHKSSKKKNPAKLRGCSVGSYVSKLVVFLLFSYIFLFFQLHKAKALFLSST